LYCSRSDWDVVLIVKKPAEGISSCSAGSVDAAIIGSETFRNHLFQHKFRTLACLWAPPECVLKPCAPALLSGFVFNSATFLGALKDEVERDWERIEKW
jgi:hypothetical protein